MKITLPTAYINAGRRSYSVFAVSLTSRAFLLDVGRFYLDVYFGKRVVAYDFKAARRAHGLAGLVAFPLLVAAFLVLALPLIAVTKLGELAEGLAEFLADYVFQPVTDVLVPVQRSTFRGTLKALVKEVTA